MLRISPDRKPVIDPDEAADLRLIKSEFLFCKIIDVRVSTSFKNVLVPCQLQNKSDSDEAVRCFSEFNIQFIFELFIACDFQFVHAVLLFVVPVQLAFFGVFFRFLSSSQ